MISSEKNKDLWIEDYIKRVKVLSAQEIKLLETSWSSENNKVENLYWCTNQENTQQCIRDGRFNIPSPKLSEESINKMIEDYESGMSNLQIKVKYGISIMTMYKYFSERGVIWKKGKR